MNGVEDWREVPRRARGAPEHLLRAHREMLGRERLIHVHEPTPNRHPYAQALRDCYVQTGRPARALRFIACARMASAHSVDARRAH